MEKEGLGGTSLKWVRVENLQTYSLSLFIFFFLDYIDYTVEPPLTVTSPQRTPLYDRHIFCPGRQSIHSLLLLLK